MGKESYERYLKAKECVDKAIEWNELPSGEKYLADTMKVSPTHCKAPLLVRAGQKYQGGQTYWNSPEDLNKAILDVIIADQENIINKAIFILKQKESVCLIETQNFIDELQEKVKKAKE